MNRRGFISLLAGTAGAGLIPWRIPRPVIVLPARAHGPLCNCLQCALPRTTAQLYLDIEAVVERIWSYEARVGALLVGPTSAEMRRILADTTPRERR